MKGGAYFYDTVYFYLKPNCNIKIQEPYRKLLFANSRELGGHLLQILSHTIVFRFSSTLTFDGFKKAK